MQGSLVLLGPAQSASILSSFPSSFWSVKYLSLSCDHRHGRSFTVESPLVPDFPRTRRTMPMSSSGVEGTTPSVWL